jgi:hypothetical protein
VREALKNQTKAGREEKEEKRRKRRKRKKSNSCWFATHKRHESRAPFFFHHVALATASNAATNRPHGFLPFPSFFFFFLLSRFC